jgi:serine/threonine protein kinase
LTLTFCNTGTETLKKLSPSEISLNELEIGSEVGSGSYGRVCVGKWNAAPVALKFCKKKGKMEDFMREIKLMMYVSS